MSFTFEQLAAFVAVAEEQHFGRAAERLRITQSPLSRQIQTLERQLGVSLLDRSGRQAKLSAAGETFLIEARRLLDLAETASESARRAAAGESGLVHLGFTSIVGNEVLPDLLSGLMTNHAELQVVLHEMTTALQREALLNGRLDVGLCRPYGTNAVLDDLVVRPLTAARLVLVAAKGSAIEEVATRLSEGGRLTMPIERLDGQDFIMYASNGPNYVYDLLTAAFQTYKIRPRTVQRVVEAYTMLRLVGAGIGAAIVPVSALIWAPPDIVLIDVPELAAYRVESVVAWHAETRNPAVPTLLAAIREVSSINRRDD